MPLAARGGAGTPRRPLLYGGRWMAFHWSLAPGGGDRVGEGDEPDDRLLEILERHVLEPVAYHQPGKFSERIRLEEVPVRGIGDIGVPKLPAIGIDRCLVEDRPDRPR